MRARRFGLIIVATIIVLVALLSLISGSANVTWNQSSTVPDIFKSSVAFGSNSIIFSNGRQFVEYNYISGHSTPISPDGVDQTIGNIDSLRVSSDKNYLVFHSQEAPAGSQMESYLRANGLDPTQPYWWLYDALDDSFRSLPSDVTSVRLTKGLVYTLSGEDTSKSIIKIYGVRDLKLQKTIEVASSSDFYVVNDGFVLVGAGELNVPVMFTSDGVVNRQLADRVTSVANVNSNSESGLLIRDTGKNPRLLLFSLDGSVKEQATNVDTVAASEDNDALISVKSLSSEKPSKLFLYNHTTGKLGTLEIKDLSVSGTFPVSLFSAHVGTLAYLNGGLIMAGNDFIAPKQPPANYDKSLRVSGNIVDLKYYPDESAFIVTLDGSAVSQERAAIYKQLKEDGLDPALLDIRFSVFAPPTEFPSE